MPRLAKRSFNSGNAAWTSGRSAFVTRRSAGASRARRRTSRARVDRVEVFLGLAALVNRQLEEVQEHLRALDVPQEPMPEAGALGRALDQARDVGEDEAPVLRHADDAEVRSQRRERVVGDLRPRARDHRQERRLADVRVAEEARLGEELQLEADVRSSPGVPGSDVRGAWFHAVLKWMLPRPPLPPLQTMARWPSVVRSTRTSPVALSFTIGADGDADNQRVAALAD